ncbi:MAG TPA: hypothetical protein VMZ22_11245 [Acidimicrobiales bacterium]|nr:hypothetical protein [Acidimicrobiales bacterium]
MTTTVTATPTRSGREEAAIAVFGTWMICGLFLDGWAHETDRPETFFSPWHGILYSGFVAALVWFSWDGWRQKRAGQVTSGPTDRAVTVGLIVFIIGAVGDGIWHEVFGIEVDLEALVSPSHLALFIGGFLMVSSPVRAAANDPAFDPSPGWRAWCPQAVTLTLSAALVLFFAQYLSVFEDVASASHGGSDREFREVVDLASILATNLILVVPMLFVLWRWRAPFWTFTLLFTGTAVFVSGLEGFDLVELVIAFAVGGFVADATAARGVKPIVAASASALGTWTAFFLIADFSYGVAWSPELWAGAIVLATASSALLASLMRPAVVQPPTSL